MIRSIRDMVLALFMMGWEILLIIMSMIRYDRTLGLFHQANDYYVMVAVLCIFSVVLDTHIDASHKRVNEL